MVLITRSAPVLVAGMMLQCAFASRAWQLDGHPQGHGQTLISEHTIFRYEHFVISKASHSLLGGLRRWTSRLGSPTRTLSASSGCPPCWVRGPANRAARLVPQSHPAHCADQISLGTDVLQCCWMLPVLLEDAFMLCSPHHSRLPCMSHMPAASTSRRSWRLHRPLSIIQSCLCAAGHLCQSGHLSGAPCMRAGQLWPYLDAAVSSEARHHLEPKLKERRARWMLDIAIAQLRSCTCTLPCRPRLYVCLT